MAKSLLLHVQQKLLLLMSMGREKERYKVPYGAVLDKGPRRC